jgi:hypothetical protein
VFSKFFNNPVITQYSPDVMSNFGLLMILVWGLAYVSVAKKYKEVKWLIAVFALEKFIYGFVWINWMINNNVLEVYAKDKMAGIFYAIYGVNDWLFFIFFLFVFINLSMPIHKISNT